MQSAPQRPSPSRLLVVDDEPAVRRAVGSVLRTAGHDVTEVDSGSDGLALLRGSLRGDGVAFDAIVSDVAMPGLDGVQLLRAVRAIDLEVPFILLTGSRDVASAAAAVGLGAFKYLLKPIEPTQLREVVARAIELKRLARMKLEALVLTGAGAATQDRAALEVEFARALTGLWIAYQPIVGADARTLYGYEALVRTSAPAFPGPPALFDAAARLGAGRALSRRIRALAAAAFIDGETEGVLFVNVNPDDLNDEALYDATAPLTTMATRVVLEVTERASLDQVVDVRERVARLRSLGFRIALDDLGAGYAGLTSFALLEPEVVKIDMALVRDADRSPTKRRLIRSMTALCKDMGMLVVAEGVETTAERDTVTELGCELLQGYLFARPGPPFPTWTWGDGAP